MLRGILIILLVFTFLFSLSVFLMVRAAPQSRTLVLTGHPGELPVVEIGGRSYVDVEALTRLANGSLSKSGNRGNGGNQGMAKYAEKCNRTRISSDRKLGGQLPGPR